MDVDIIVYDGLDEMDAWGPAEVLRSAAAMGADVSVRLLTCEPVAMVTGAYGLRFVPDAVLAEDSEVLIVPGGGWVDRAETGAWAEVRRGDLVERIAAVAATARVVAGVCTGTMLLAHAGVIAGRRAATHHSARRELADLGATVVDDRVVDDGDLITSGGVTSGIDLALWLLEREVSTHMADQVAARMEYRRTRPATTS